MLHHHLKLPPQLLLLCNAVKKWENHVRQEQFQPLATNKKMTNQVKSAGIYFSKTMYQTLNFFKY